jgi:hypothetical protein
MKNNPPSEVQGAGTVETSTENQPSTMLQVAIWGFVAILAFGLLARAGRFLIPVLPLGSVLIGFLLHQRAPALYVGFTWWLWFLTPLVRRIIDYQSGYVTPGNWILASLLVTMISGITFIRYLPKTLYTGGLPFILCVVSVTYGFLVGVIQKFGGARYIVASMGWFGPIFFGFYLYVHWRQYPQIRRTLQTTFLWGVIVMGAYGIWQYLVAPAWDTFWLEFDRNPTYGLPAPLQIRVWSTMMIPQKFATVMMAGLLMLFSTSSSLRFPAAGVGILSILLSLIRTAWLNGIVGLLILLPSLRPRLQGQAIIGLTVIIAMVIPLATVEPFSTVLSSRFESLGGGSDDVSYQTRLDGTQAFLDTALLEVFGRGLGSAIDNSTSAIGSFDNGLLVMLTSFGWLGTIPYLVALVSLLLILFQITATHHDAFLAVARAIALSIFVVQIGLNPFHIEDFGMILWSFTGVGLAGKEYYQHDQRTASSTELPFGSR